MLTLKEDKEKLPDIDEDNLFVVLYTSGSTGKPKGVMIEQHNLANFVNLNKKHLAIYSFVHDIKANLAIASISFDMSIFEIMPPLCNGTTICMAIEDEIHNPIKLMDLIISEFYHECKKISNEIIENA